MPPHADVGDEPALRAAWSTVCDKIEAHLLAQKQKLKSFEVHHFTERARKAFLTAYMAGEGFDGAQRASLFAVGLW